LLLLVLLPQLLLLPMLITDTIKLLAVTTLATPASLLQ
jgi:hypothetical protein